VRRAVRAGGMSILLRESRKELYIPCTMTSNNVEWERGWFYLHNEDPGLPLHRQGPEGEGRLLVAWLLMVKICQPSHEFTFGVGISFIPYPLVLAPWYNKFTCACRFWSLVFMQGFSVESKTFGISSSSTL
jgi:hypothetical protein